MKLIDRMLLSELLVPFLAGTLAVVLMLIGNMLFFMPRCCSPKAYRW
jgi:lipopolysaccharide export LptBFGC system permease protein LptF